MKKIAILASGSGTNAENIAKIFNSGTEVRVSLVITNRAKAGVIARMEPLGVETVYVPNSVWDNEPEKVVELLKSQDIDIVVLAGFMHYVSPVIIRAYSGRIINIHPSLLPRHGGKGMYGHYVHEAVIAAGDRESGVTVHHVTEEMDEGEIIMQESVEVTPEDTAETLEAKIHPVEYSLYPRAIAKLVRQLGEAEQASVRPVEEAPRTMPEPPKTVDEQWAEALQIKYETPKMPGTPPPPSPMNFTGEPVPPMYGGPVRPQMNVEPQAAVPAERPPMPRQWLLWSILVTLCCCTPLGIVAIVYSALVSSRYYKGDFEGAEKASHNAEIWIIAAFVLGLVWATVQIPLMLL